MSRIVKNIGDLLVIIFIVIGCILYFSVKSKLSKAIETEVLLRNSIDTHEVVIQKIKGESQILLEGSLSKLEVVNLIDSVVNSNNLNAKSFIVFVSSDFCSPCVNSEIELIKKFNFSKSECQFIYFGQSKREAIIFANTMALDYPITFVNHSFYENFFNAFDSPFYCIYSKNSKNISYFFQSETYLPIRTETYLSFYKHLLK